MKTQIESYETEGKVKDIANFFTAENASESIKIAKKFDADYVLVNYPTDKYKFSAIVVASEKSLGDYIISERLNPDDVENRTVVKKETIGIKNDLWR